MKRGSFLKFLGFGAGAAAVSCKTEDKSEKIINELEGAATEMADKPMGEFQNEDFDTYSHFRKCICIKSSPSGMNQVGDIVYIRGLPKNWIELKGQALLRCAFRELDDAVYVGDKNNKLSHAFYHVDHSGGYKRNPNGEYLILPDSRGIPF